MPAADGTVQLLANQPWQPWWARVTIVLQPLHFGDYGGRGVKVLYSLGGLLPALLSLSGFAIWRFRGPAERRLQSYGPDNPFRVATVHNGSVGQHSESRLG